ncbi:hypothetical protein KY361_02245 [Candidatus Woesearchaeota archaeon]|nr:hypothetical protein [Candidatus Woesearchaeota archaeon]
MQNTIIIYEPIESQDNFSIDNLDLYKKLGGDATVKNLEFYVSFYEDFG